MGYANRHPRPPAVPTSTEPTCNAEPPEAAAPNRGDGGRGVGTALDQFRADLRGYLIERFRDDEMSREELNRVLRRFGLPTCDGPIRVHNTLTGHVEIDVAAGEGVDRASFTVGVHLTQIDMLVDGSSQHDALVKVYSSVPVGVVLYTVSGHYDVTTPDIGYAATEANGYLYPDLFEEALISRLLRLPPADIVAFEVRFDELQARVDRDERSRCIPSSC